MKRAFGILTDDHPSEGRIPRILRPVPLVIPDGMIWGVGYEDFAWRAARENEHGIIPAAVLARLPQWLRRELLRKGARPGIAGGRQQDSHRVVSALFALSASLKTNLYIVSSVTAGQQSPIVPYFESSCDGSTGNWTYNTASSTHTTAGTAGTAPTVTQIGHFPAKASGTATGGVIGGNYTAEPTVIALINALILPLPTSPLIVQHPLGRDVEGNPVATTAMRGIAMRGLVSTGTPNMQSTLEFEE